MHRFWRRIIEKDFRGLAPCLPPLVHSPILPPSQSPPLALQGWSSTKSALDNLGMHSLVSPNPFLLLPLLPPCALSWPALPLSSRLARSLPLSLYRYVSLSLILIFFLFHSLSLSLSLSLFCFSVSLSLYPTLVEGGRHAREHFESLRESQAMFQVFFTIYYVLIFYMVAEVRVVGHCSVMLKHRLLA